MQPFGEVFGRVVGATGSRPQRVMPKSLAIFALLLGTAGITAAMAGPAAASGVTRYVNATGSDAGDCTDAGSPCATVGYAVSQSGSGDTIEVTGTIAGTVTIPDSFGTITITGNESPLNQPAVLDGGAAGTVVTVGNGAQATLDYLTIQNGASTGNGGGVENNGTTYVTNSTLTANSGTNGGGIDNNGSLTVGNSTLDGNTASQNGGGISSEAGTVTVSGSTLADNDADASGGAVSLTGANQITESTISGNTAGSGGGIDNSGTLTLIGSTVSSNTPNGIVGSTTIAGTIVAENSIADCASAQLSDGYNLSSDASCGFTNTGDIQNGNPELGPLTENGGPTDTQMPASNGAGVAVLASPTSVDGFSLCGGTTDQRGLNRPFASSHCSIGAVETYPGVSPTIGGIDQSLFNVNAFKSITLSATAYPPATFTETGSLPPGVSLTRAGVLAGTPGSGSVGSYPITLSADNGVGGPTTSPFTLIVSAPASIPESSPNSAVFLDSTANSFTVEATGSPVPTVTVGPVSGKLPSWLTVSSAVAGTATLNGTPPRNTKKIYVLNETATNGGGSVTQSFTLTVGYAPTILSVGTATLKVGVAKNFNVRTAGYPLPTVTEAGTLPNGLSFVNSTAGKGQFTGTPLPGSGGVYDLSLSATSVAGTVTQAFVLTVDENPTFTSPNSVTFTHGTENSFTITTGHSYPAVTSMINTSKLPTGVTFTYTGNGTGVLAGDPIAARSAPYYAHVYAISPIHKTGQLITLTVN
jgi:large repetitive protein